MSVGSGLALAAFAIASVPVMYLLAWPSQEAIDDAERRAAERGGQQRGDTHRGEGPGFAMMATASAASTPTPESNAGSSPAPST